MKRIIIIIMLICMAVMVFADSYTFSKEEKLIFSELDKQHMEEFDPEGWVILVKQLGMDKIEASFPVGPELSLGESPDIHIYTAEDEGALFSLTVLSKNWNLEEYLQQFSSFESFQTGEGYVDLAYEKNGHIQERIYFNQENSFLFRTKNASAADHDQFVSSFSVIKPLPKS